MENKKCGRITSVVQGWKCEKCGETANSATELWKKQEKCKGGKNR